MMVDPQFCAECGTVLPQDGKRRRYCPGCLLKAGLQEDHSGPVETAVLRGGKQAPPAAELSEWFPKLEILDNIGSGGMGWVYRARQIDLDRQVALKVLPLELTGKEDLLQRFRREAQALAQLSHENIVTVYDFGEAGDYVYFIMELVDGANLREIMREEALPTPDAIVMVQQICTALQYAHGQGVVHRDIKPENILVDSTGRVQIADFGLARLVNPTDVRPLLTASHQVLGTPHYMAPEQWERPRDVDHRADIYAVGVLFYEMLTGELPLGRFEPPSQRVALDPRLDAVVWKALEKDPGQRYQNIADLDAAIHSIVASGLRTPSQPRRGAHGHIDASVSSPDDSLGAEIYVALLALVCVVLPVVKGMSPVLLWLCILGGVVIPGSLALRHCTNARGIRYGAILLGYVACTMLAIALIPQLACEVDFCLQGEPGAFDRDYSEYYEERQDDVQDVRGFCGAIFGAAVLIAILVASAHQNRREAERQQANSPPG
jgi:predicted Ser/Thr protein kinase